MYNGGVKSEKEKVKSVALTRIAFSVLGVLGLLVLPAGVFAQDSAADVATAAGLGDQSILTTIGTVIAVILGLVGVIFLLLLVYSGFVWMTAGGDEDKIKKAKRTLINATIGIIITFSAYAIASFVLNAIGDATGANGDGDSSSSVSACTNCSSLGSGPIRDHYPARSASGVARNTRIMVTFKDEMDVASFIDGYDSDATATAINSTNVEIYPTDAGPDGTLTAVDVYFTDDLKTFVFDPTEYLGSATADTSYTVVLGPDILDADGDDVFTGSYADGYEWSFEVSTTIDLEPPTVSSIVPSADAEYDRNITIEITFNEAIDPTSATGTRTATSGFQNIQTTPSSGTPEAGTYEISNEYRTITFTSTDACGTNSCGETIYCLPGDETITVTALAATADVDPPQADDYPYDGVVDTAANSLDGNEDGTAGDDFAWSFTTTDDINLDGPSIATISPDLADTDVALDSDITVVFNGVMTASTLSNEYIAMENVESSTNESHEMWYSVGSTQLQADGTAVTSPSQTAAQTTADVGHGVFLESTDGLTYLYGVVVGEGVRNQYQNCFVPGMGPDTVASTCDPDDASSDCCVVDEDTPSCCNGTPGTDTCDFFTPSNE